MSAEDEIRAMGAVSKALEGLDDDGRARVLAWAASHYKVASSNVLATRLGATVQADYDGRTNSSSFETFAELFDAANPVTEKDKAMIAAYWVQVCENAGSFQSQVLNDHLKHLGHGIGNITEALSQLRDDRPSLVLQLKKSGSSRQARKTYKLTIEGSKRVEAMTRGEQID